MYTGAGCFQGRRALGRNRGDVLFLSLQTFKLSLSSHKRHLGFKEAKHYREHFAKTGSFSVKLKPLLSPHLLLASDMQHIPLELLRVCN